MFFFAQFWKISAIISSSTFLVLSFSPLPSDVNIIYLVRGLWTSIHVYIYTHTCMCVCIYLYIYLQMILSLVFRFGNFYFSLFKRFSSLILFSVPSILLLSLSVEIFVRYFLCQIHFICCQII